MLDANESGDLTPKAKCAQELIDEYHHFGIPHFQRGLVWNDDGVALLLKSLYLRTPCGNIILWQPREPIVQGVPLYGNAFKYLIVDGQQRIRSLHGALSVSSADLSPDAELGSEWYLNLAADPAFGTWFGDQSRFGLFVLTRKRFDNLVPIRFLLTVTEDDWERFNGFVRLRQGGDSDVRTVFDIVRHKMQNMLLHKVFACVTLVEDRDHHQLADVIDIYNRINSAGRRVEAEERAYATLVKIAPSAHERLREFFRAVHPDQDRHTGVDRDNLLQRRRESAFGFKLYMRTFVQACNYHLGRSQGADALSFDLLDNPDVLRRLRADAKNMEELLGITHRSLATIHSVITRELCCDDLQMLPDTACLVPVVELLIRFPQLVGEPYRQLLAYLILRLSVEPERRQDTTMKLAILIDTSHTAHECCDRLGERLPWGDTRRKAFGQRLAEANTLRDRYVLLLYWLIRRREAMDFSYAKNLEAKAAQTLYDKFGGHETAVCKAADPEKQHIDPVSQLKAAFGSEDRIRNARHEVNNIGNLTFISQALNSCFGGGLGDRLARLADEPTENLHRHFVDAETLALYNQFETTRDPAALKRLFRNFCEKRRSLIQKGFEDWLEQLRRALVVHEERVEPKARIFFEQDPGDHVRRFIFPDPIEDALLCMLGYGFLVCTFSQGKPRFYLGGKRRQAAEVVLITGDRVEIEDKPGAPHMDELRRITEQKSLFPMYDCPACQSRHNPPRWVMKISSPDTAAVLAELAHIMMLPVPDSLTA